MVALVARVARVRGKRRAGDKRGRMRRGVVENSILLCCGSEQKEEGGGEGAKFQKLKFETKGGIYSSNTSPPMRPHKHTHTPIPLPRLSPTTVDRIYFRTSTTKNPSLSLWPQSPTSILPPFQPCHCWCGSRTRWQRVCPVVGSTPLVSLAHPHSSLNDPSQEGDEFLQKTEGSMFGSGEHREGSAPLPVTKAKNVCL